MCPQVRQYCPAGHQLTNLGRRRGWSCDNPEGCSRGGSGSDDWRCRECDFDLRGVCDAQVKPGERAPGPADSEESEAESDDGFQNLLNELKKAMEQATTWTPLIQHGHAKFREGRACGLSIFRSHKVALWRSAISAS